MCSSAVRALALVVALVGMAPGVAHAAGTPVARATPAQKDTARKIYLEAKENFEARRFADALREFRASYEVVASPNTHLMVGHCLRELGRHSEAFETFGTVATEADAIGSAKYQATAEQAREQRSQLKGRIAFVTVRMPDDPGATLRVGGRDVPTAAWSNPIAVDPGRIDAVYTPTIGDPVTRQAELAAGQSRELTFIVAAATPSVQSTPDDPPSSWSFTGTQQYIAYAAAGLGVAGLVGAAITGSAAQRRHDELEDACGDVPCPDRQDDIDAGKTLVTTTNVLLGVGGVLLAGGVVLFLTAPGEEASAASTGPEVTALRLGPASFALEGRF